ncbi:MAG: LytR family transcriptional regulator [Clostridia bacterium]|nr:LytR family transcriptional regulator [Clostridia bacterium]
MEKENGSKDELNTNNLEKSKDKKSSESENNAQKKSDEQKRIKEQPQPQEEILFTVPKESENEDIENEAKDENENIDFDKYLENIDDNEVDESNESSLEMKDISSKTNFWQRFVAFWKRKDNKGKKVLVIFLAILLIFILMSGAYLASRLSFLGTNADEEPVTGQDDVIYNEIDFSMMNDITDAKSLNELIKDWATNKGEKMSSKNVINVLLIGIDSSSNLSDSMILMSLNKSTKKINMVSFYRDSYIYIAPTSGKARFGKLNSAYSAGGAKCVVETIENNYKIKIDEYASVDYNSFPKVIDALGGVTLNVQAYEANYMNNAYGFKIKSGVTTLNGEEALMYSRIRHSDKDGDVSRARRQRAVITAIINSTKSASVTQFDNMMKTLFPNVKTSMSQSQVLGYGTQALTNGWLSFDVVQANMPTADTSKGGYIGTQWVWIADYPGAAYQLQTLLYGKSNIKLADDRVSAIKIKPTTTKATTTTITTTTKSDTQNETQTSKLTTTTTTTTTTTPTGTSSQTDPTPDPETPPETTLTPITGG